MNVKIAAAQYDISFLETWENYQKKSEFWVRDAAEQGAKILLFPEYNTMELASLFSKAVYSSLNEQLGALQTVHKTFLNLFQSVL